MAPTTHAQTPLTGSQYEISAGDYQATVTELGPACASCSTGACR